LQTSKHLIRDKINLIEIPNRDKRDLQLIEQLKQFNNRIILGFSPIKLEPNITPFLIERDKNGYIIGLPAIIDGKIIFKRFSQRTKIGKFGIIESDTDQLIDLSCQEILCLTPLIASAACDRLGRGGGYYDRFFASHPNILKLGVCYREQVLDAIPMEGDDVRLDLIVTC